MGVDGTDRTNQLILPGRQAELPIATFALDVRIEAYRQHDRIGMRGKLHRKRIDQLVLLHDADTQESPSDVRCSGLLQHDFVRAGTQLAPGVPHDRLRNVRRIDHHLIVDEQAVAAGVLHEDCVRARRGRCVPCTPALERLIPGCAGWGRQQHTSLFRGKRIGKRRLIRVSKESIGSGRESPLYPHGGGRS